MGKMSLFGKKYTDVWLNPANRCIFVADNRPDSSFEIKCNITTKPIIFLNLTQIMRKAFLLLAAVLLLPVAMSAQLLGNGELKLQHAPYALKTFKSPNTRLMSPAKADLADNQMIMGHYDTDDYESDGLGITGMPGVLPLGTIITPSELAMFQGGKIVRFRVALAASTTVSRVFVIPVSATGVYGTTTEWSCNVNAVGWNEIELATPYDINLENGESLMIGFDYRQTSSNYPIAFSTQGTICPSYLYANNIWNNFFVDRFLL